MAYNIKDVFFLDVSTTITAGTGGNGSSQLDLSAYIDPISRGRQKATGLAVYRVMYSLSTTAIGSSPIDVAETSVCRYGLVAGAGLGDNATGAVTLTATSTPMVSNKLAISGADYYGPKSTIANASTPLANGANGTIFMEPSKDVPYVIVRDNVCLVYGQTETAAADMIINARLECAQIGLDQSTLNQLLRTQTV
jgi:hypothetical protein